jgi:Tfp pilus assembly protein PilX
MRAPRPKGVVALITVLVVMVTLLSIGLTISVVGNDEAVLTGVVEDGEIAFTIADACAEEGMFRLKTNPAYAGGSFALDGGACTVAVTNLGGNDRLVRGQGEYRYAVRIVDAHVTIQNNGGNNAKKIKVNSWLEAN